MANRPVYTVGNERNLCNVHDVEFEYQRGLSKVQRQRSSKCLQAAFLSNRPNHRVLEVSRFSEYDLGIKLSAFNLTVTMKNGRKLPVECAFQGGKITKEYGQLIDLYDKSPAETKEDPRKKNGTLIGFEFDGETFGLMPRTAFYNWLYIRALSEHPELGATLMEYDAFTDIAFNPQKSINCQAEACAYYVALRKYGLLDQALKSKDSFIEVLYHTKPAATAKFPRPTLNKPIPPAEVPKLPAVPAPEIHVGESVKHPKFGDGVVKEVSFDGSTELLTVAFAAGPKTISKNWLIQAMEKMK